MAWSPWRDLCLFLAASDYWVLGALLDKFQNAGPLTSLYEFGTSKPTANSLAAADWEGQDFTTLPGVDASDSGMVRVEDTGFLKVHHGCPVQAETGRVNEWTMLMDVQFADLSMLFACLCQTNLYNDDDGEEWLKHEGRLLLGRETGYGEVDMVAGLFYRIVITIKLSANSSEASAGYYVNGRFVHELVGPNVGTPGGRYSLDPAGLYLLRDNDGEQAPAYVTTAAFWSQALSPDAVARLGHPDFGASDAPFCAGMDFVSTFVVRGGLPPIDDLGVTACGSSCCRGSAARPCEALDPRFVVDGSGSCMVDLAMEVCSCMRPENEPDKALDRYAAFCTPKAGTPAPPGQETTLAAVAVRNTFIDTSGELLVFFTAVAAFMNGTAVPLDQLSPSLQVKAMAVHVDERMPTTSLEMPFKLMQSTITVLAGASPTSAAAAPPAHVFPSKGDYFTVTSMADVGPVLGTNSLPIPRAVIGAAGLSTCKAAGSGVIEGTESIMVSARCPSSYSDTRIVSMEGSADARCKQWRQLFKKFGVKKFGILFSRMQARGSSYMADMLEVLSAGECVPKCQIGINSPPDAFETLGLCLQTDPVELCIESFPTTTCRDDHSVLLQLRDGMETGQPNDVRVILAGLENNVYFIELAAAAKSLGMTGPGYVWIFVADQFGYCEPAVAQLEFEEAAAVFNGALLLVQTCDGPQWSRFAEVFGRMKPGDFPDDVDFLSGDGLDVTGGGSYGVNYNGGADIGIFFKHFEVGGVKAVDPDYAMMVDATWTTLAAMNRLETAGHASWAVPPRGLLAEMETIDMPGVCGGRLAVDASGRRPTAIPLKVFSLRNSSTEFTGWYGNPYFWDLTYLGTVTESSADFVEDPTFFNGSKPIPVHTPPFCGIGEEPDKALSCLKCREGMFSDLAGRFWPCRACPVGWFTDKRGQSKCLECEGGQYANATGTTKCHQCEPGWFQPSRGQTLCFKCGPGTRAANTSSVTCKQCPLGRFQAADGSSECQACPGNLVTPSTGATSLGDCLCPTETYRTLGGGCEQCPTSMHCELGSDLANLANPLAGSKEFPVPELEPRYWASLEAPLDIFRCRSDARCPGGKPGSACGQGLEGQACEHCKAGAHFDGQACVECDGANVSKAFFVILSIICVIALVICIYMTSRSPVQQWGRWHNGLGIVFFLTLGCYQMVDLVSSSATTLPVQDAALIKPIWQFTNNPLTVFKMDCAGVGNFGYTLIFGCIFPLVVMSIALLVWVGSVFVAMLTRRDHMRMDGDGFVNVGLSLMFTFFNGIVSQSLQLFKPFSNPNGKSTVSKDLSITVGEAEWTSLLGVSIPAVLFYVVGMGGYFMMIVYLSPRQGYFNSPSFRRRYRFLFVKFRPDVYWFSLVILLKNMLVNLMFVISKIGMIQLYCVMLVMMLYLFVVFLFMPFRHNICNFVDVWMSIAVIFVVSVYLWFADRESGSYDASIGQLAIGMNFMPITVTLVFSFYWIAVHRQSHHVVTQRVITDFKKLKRAAEVIVNMEEENGIHWMGSLVAPDRLSLRSAVFIMEAELLGQPGTRLTLGEHVQSSESLMSFKSKEDRFVII